MASRILIISDTHGLIRPEIAELAPRYDHLLHAGDIGSPLIYERLKALNPNLHAVAGNVDRELMAAGFPRHLEWRHKGRIFKIVHELGFGSAETSGADFVIFGHSHRPEEYCREGTHFINPGAVGPRRFRLPVSYATMKIDATLGYAVEFHLIETG